MRTKSCSSARASTPAGSAGASSPGPESAAGTPTGPSSRWRTLIPVPDGLGLREAAALLHDGPTALALFDNAEVKPQEWVLVLGAALGLLLVQLARAAGARVIGAARGGRKLDPVREMGAEVAIDYSEPNWVE